MPIGQHLRDIGSDKFVLAWNASNLASVIFPLIFFAVARSTNSFQDDGDGQQQDNQYDEYGNYVGPTHWWQFWKSSNNGNQNNQQGGEDRDGGAPWWWLWGDQDEPDEEGHGTIVFVYLWTLVLVFALTVYGNRLMKAGNFEALRFALLGFANYAFICCVLLGGLDAVKSDGREMEESGWYGQTSVLLVLTCFFMLIVSVIFSLRLRSRIKAARADAKQEGFLSYNSPQNSGQGVGQPNSNV